ncbi:MAG TPA: ribosome-binding factor A [Candidatus Peribacteria bacterium]|nr:ribosome-binding factor A [Candidatus Peribacteria bacterium]
MVSHRPQSAANMIRSIVGGVAREIPPDVAQIVSITEVVVSPDVAHATVYVTALTNAKEASDWLHRNAGRKVKPLIAKQLNIYTVPSLRFVVDTRPEKANRIDELLR